ncbi:MAG: glycosyltransferase [Candidatus Eremiobacteraeota bacterium]|nr:glycosyltransferase [Candidatus Eremiobacteraeota bacterium]
MNKTEKRIYVLANSPGEIAGWLRPSVKVLKELLPEYGISVVLLPCVFASGGEKSVVQAIPGVDEVIPPAGYPALLLDRSGKSSAELLHLGGEITLTAFLARSWEAPAWAYQWGKKSVDQYFHGYFVKTESDREALVRSGISGNKAFVVGDLLVDSVKGALKGDTVPREEGPVEEICFMAGSRLKELRTLLPFYLEISKYLREKFPAVKFKALISPFVDWQQFAGDRELLPVRQFGGLRGIIDEKEEYLRSDEGLAIRLVRENHLDELAGSDFVITIPGTKTGEAGCLGRPMVVLLPLNRPEEIPYIGIVGLLDWLPLLGRLLKAPLIRRIAKTLGAVAQPNILARREIVPEIKGVLEARQVAGQVMTLMADQEALAKMRGDLKELYRPFEGATERMIRIFAKSARPDLDSETPCFSLVICTRNRKELLEGAIKTLDDQKFPSAGYEILVVDDGSEDGTDELVMTMKTRCALRYLKRTWGGRAATRNYGIQEARGDVIIFVDDDILAPPDFIAEHARFHRMFPRAVVRGPIINIDRYEFPRDIKAGLTDFSQAFFCTCNVSVPRRELQDVGGFDESFVEYGYEDNEVGWRLRQRGLKARFNTKAIIYHYKPRKREEDLPAMIRTAQELARSAVMYYEKHPDLKVRLATGINSLYFLKQSLFAGPFFKNRWVRKWKKLVHGGTNSEMLAVEKKIFGYYYAETLREELKKKGLL